MFPGGDPAFKGRTAISWVRGDWLRVSVPLDQTPYGLTALNSQDEEWKREWEEHATHFTQKHEQPEATHLLRSLAARKEWYTSPHQPEFDCDGDEKNDFAFYSQLEPGRWSLELFLSDEKAPLGGKKISDLLSCISQTHHVSLIAADGALLTHPMRQPDGLLGAILQASRPDLIEEAWRNQQEPLRAWNTTHGPDGVLVLDPNVAPEGMKPDVLPGTPAHDEALAYIRDLLVRPGRMKFLDPHRVWQGTPPRNPFHLSFDGHFSASERASWEKTVQEAFELFLAASPEGKPLGHPDVAKRVRLVISKDLEATQKRLKRPHPFPSDADAVTNWHVDPNDSALVDGIDVVMIPERSEHSRGDVLAAIPLDVYLKIVLVKEFHNTLVFDHWGGSFYSRYEGQLMSHKFHLDRLEQLADKFESAGTDSAIVGHLRVYIAEWHSIIEGMRQHLIEEHL